MRPTGFRKGIETARIGSCFMVVVLHVAAVDFYDFDNIWWASNFYDSFTRVCVPIFLMITGCLLLDQQEGLPVFFRKRFMRVLPPLLFWSFFYLAWYTWQGEHFGSAWGWLGAMAQGPVAYHLWYLYAIVGIYLFVPFLRLMWQRASNSEKRLYLIAWALASSWPLAQQALGLDLDVLTTYEMGSFFGLAGYLFLGAYLHQMLLVNIDRPGYWWTNSAVFILGSVATMVLTWLYSRSVGEPDPLFYDYLSPFVIVASAGAFNLLYGAGMYAGRLSVFSSRSSARLTGMATCTLGIYCIHIFVLDVVRNQSVLVSGNGSAWWTIPVTAVVVFVAAWAVIGALRQIRPFRYVT